MTDLTTWPDWMQAARLLSTVLLTAGLGVHAFYQHKRESSDVASPRKWMYWAYAMAFAAAGAANFLQFSITVVFRNYEKATFHLGYSTVLLMLSYAALLTGVRRRMSE